MEHIGTIAAILLTCGAVFFAIFTVNLVLVEKYRKDRSEQRDAEVALLRNLEKQKAKASLSLRRDVGIKNGPLASQPDEEPPKSLWFKLGEMCNQSGLTIVPMQVVLYGLICGLVGGSVLGLMFSSVLFGLIGCFAAIWIPLCYVSHKRNARAELLRSQLPDAFELMSRIMRSGQTITQAMNAVSEEFLPPVATEFGYCYEQQNLGLSPDFALRELARRAGIMELRIFVVALAVHRQTGGNLTELLDKLAQVVRQRTRLFGDVKGLTAEGRMQAIILMGLPVAVWIAMYFFNRTYALKLFEHPELIAATLVAMAIGAFSIHKIVNFDF